MYIYYIRVNLLLLGLIGLISVPVAAEVEANKIKVQIKGINQAEIINNILAMLQIEQQKANPRLSERRINRLHNRAEEDIREALKPFGYYRPKINGELIPPAKPDELWQANYQVELGEAVLFNEVKVDLIGEAVEDLAFQQLLADLPIMPGSIFNSLDYEATKRKLRNLAEARGYFQAEFVSSQFLLDESNYTASAEIIFDAGIRYKFGELNYEQVGQTSFDQSLMDRYKTFASGEHYNEDTMLAFRTALVNSGYFSQVEVAIQRPDPENPESDDYIVPVQVVLTPRKRNLYTASIGYGTDTGLRGGLGWERRYLNRYGHSARADLQLSEIKQSASANYFVPLGADENNFLNFKAGYLREDNDIFDTELLVLGLSKHHIRNLFNFRLQEAVGLEYRYEKYQIGEDRGQAKLLMPNIAWSLINADDRIYTTDGYKITLSLRGAVNKIGSDNSFLQTNLSGKYIRRLFSAGRIIARGELGYTTMSLLNGEFRDLPPSIRHFAGGDQSVRGYDYNSLGPTDSKNYVIGGKNLMVASIEYEHTIIGNWGAAVFYDVGNAFNEYNEYSDSLAHGLGLGLRWRSPIGLVRLDVATALSKDGYPLRLHINIGPDL